MAIMDEPLDHNIFMLVMVLLTLAAVTVGIIIGLLLGAFLL